MTSNLHYCFLVTLIVAIFSNVLGQDIYKCEDGWSQLNLSCYKRFDQSSTRDEAQQICQENGANLVSIHSDAENDFVTNLARKANALLLSLISRNVWIGLEITTPGCNLTWSDNSTVNYTNWALLEPTNFGNNNGVNCVALRGCSAALIDLCPILFQEGKWDDIDCTIKAPTLICKKPACIQVYPVPSGYVGALMDADISQSYPLNQNNPVIYANPSTGITTTVDNAIFAYWRPTSSTSLSTLFETLDAAFDFYQSPACSPCFCVTNQECYFPIASDYSAYIIPYCDSSGNCKMLAATLAAAGPFSPFYNSAGQPMPENIYDNYNTGVYLQVVGFGCNGCEALQSKLAKLCPAASTTPIPSAGQ